MKNVLAAMAVLVAMPAFAGEIIMPIRPDKSITPGVIDQTVTLKEICTPGSAASRRNTPDSVKNSVYKAYGLTREDCRKVTPEGCEVDHFVPLVLGGADVAANLWIQSYGPAGAWTAHVKDVLEVKLHRLVCSGQMELDAARACLLDDWIACYQRTFQTVEPLPPHQGRD